LGYLKAFMARLSAEQEKSKLVKSMPRRGVVKLAEASTPPAGTTYRSYYFADGSQEPGEGGFSTLKNLAVFNTR
jgi:hypothetical protein